MEHGAGIMHAFWEIALKAFLFDEHNNPYWVKRWVPDPYDPYNYDKGHFEMLFVNKAYTRAYGKSQGDYEGKEDSVIWGEEIGKEFNESDREALINGKSKEVFQGDEFRKYRRNYIDGTILIIGRKMS